MATAKNPSNVKPLAVADRLPMALDEAAIARDEAERQVSEWERKATDSWFAKDKIES